MVLFKNKNLFLTFSLNLDISCVVHDIKVMW